METRELVEALIYKFPDLRKAFIGLNIINLERKVSASSHPEFKNILKQFKNPKIISVVGLTQITALIEPTKNGRTYPIILINGNNTSIEDLSKTRISEILFQHLRWKDYLPAPFVKKIIYISDYKKSLKGMVFSEFRPNQWTIDDPLKLPITSFRKVGGKVIINEVLQDILQE